jgi:hypothetical protein
MKWVAMKWRTRSHVHVDRVACPWLITRFVDSAAEFPAVSWRPSSPKATSNAS